MTTQPNRKHPGRLLNLLLRRKNMSIRELANETKIKYQDLDALKKYDPDSIVICDDIANKLAIVFGISPKTLLNAQALYENSQLKLSPIRVRKNSVNSSVVGERQLALQG